MRDKKVRGIKRKNRLMIQRIVDATEEFPVEFGYGYWHMKLPVEQAFIESPRTPFGVKRKCVQTLLDQADYLRNSKPKTGGYYQIVVLFMPADLWNSQILIFSEEDISQNFFNRDNDYQKWIPVSSTKIPSDWNLSISESLYTTGYKEIITDEEDDYFAEKELWFIGDPI